jgi:hypothetical protein
MSKSGSNAKGTGSRERHISVRAVRRDPPDLRKLGRAVIQLAIAQAAAEAAAQNDPSTAPKSSTGTAKRGSADATSGKAPDAES